MGSLLISVVAAIIGTYIVTRRMVFIAGGITHSSFGGLGIGYFAGISPTLSALIFAIITALGIDKMSRNKRVREDSAIAAFWALGMAVGIIFIFITPGYTPGLSEFLFGNILTITTGDIILFAAMALLLVLFVTIYYRPILYATFDGDFARTRGIPVQLINTVMILFVAVSVVLSIRLRGIMLLLSVLTLPQLIAEMFTSRLHTMMIYSGIICLICNIIGLFLSTMIAVPTGATIVTTLIAVYLIAKAVRKLIEKSHRIEQ